MCYFKRGVRYPCHRRGHGDRDCDGKEEERRPASKATIYSAWKWYPELKCESRVRYDSNGKPDWDYRSKEESSPKEHPEEKPGAVKGGNTAPDAAEGAFQLPTGFNLPAFGQGQYPMTLNPFESFRKAILPTYSALPLGQQAPQYIQCDSHLHIGNFYNFNSLQPFNEATPTLGTEIALPPPNSQPQSKGVTPVIIRPRNPHSRAEKLDPRYKTQHRSKFRLEKVFRCLDALVGNKDIQEVLYGDYDNKLNTDTWTFVIVQVKKSYCICLPITTYNSAATTRPHVNPANHAAIYDGQTPQYLDEEEVAQLKTPIKFILSRAEFKLDGEARINYGWPVKVMYDLNVRFIGEIERNSKAWLQYDFERVNPGLV